MISVGQLMEKKKKTFESRSEPRVRATKKLRKVRGTTFFKYNLM